MGCKHNSVRLDKWLEILVVEDLTLKERQHELQRQQRRRPVHSSSSLYKAREWISNGNRTECSPIWSVIIRVINKIGRPLSGSPICLTTSMITDRIGRHDVLLPINHNLNKICDIISYDFNSKHKKFKILFR